MYDDVVKSFDEYGSVLVKIESYVKYRAIAKDVEAARGYRRDNTTWNKQHYEWQVLEHNTPLYMEFHSGGSAGWSGFSSDFDISRIVKIRDNSVRRK